MLIGAHALIYSSQPERLRAFFRDVLRFPNVDAGHGWLIFTLPPAELAVHPVEEEAPAAASVGGTELYLMCDDLDATVTELRGRGVELARPAPQDGEQKDAAKGQSRMLIVMTSQLWRKRAFFQ